MNAESEGDDKMNLRIDDQYRSPEAVQSVLSRCLTLAILISSLAGCGGKQDTSGASQEEFVYVAMGASDALGAGASDPLRTGYVFILADRMRAIEPDLQIRNFATDGATGYEFINHQLPNAIEANPAVVTVWMGANDILDGHPADLFESQLRTVLGELRTKTSAMVFVGNLIDLTQTPDFQHYPVSGVTKEKVDDYNRRIAEVVAETGCFLVRISDLPLHASVFSADGFHPSDEGYLAMADKFWSVIQPQMLK